MVCVCMCGGTANVASTVLLGRCGLVAHVYVKYTSSCYALYLHTASSMCVQPFGMFVCVRKRSSLQAGQVA